MVFLHFLFKFKPFDEFIPFQNVIANLSAVCSYSACVYIHSLKTSLQLSMALFFGLKCDGQCLFYLIAILTGKECAHCRSPRQKNVYIGISG